jgi:hypothetical protein
MLIGANHEKTVDEDAALDDEARKVDQEMAPKPAH